MSHVSQESQNLHLQIGDIPHYPYVNHAFEVQLFLVDEKAQLKTNVDSVITVALFYDEKPLRPCQPNLLVIDDEFPRKVLKNGMVTMRLTLTDVSMNHDNKKFILVFYGTSINSSINEAMSHPMLCVQHRLIIKDMKENPVVWYKDEGGREKSIDMSVSLFDHNDVKVLDRRIHLKLTLQYGNGQDCPRQDIMRLNSESRLFIDEITGEALIRFRIDEVSRSHQKQLFRVLVSPDSVHYPLTSDISPDVSVPIEVRSKRNKKEKSGGGHESDQQSEKRTRLENTDAFGMLPNVGNVLLNSDGNSIPLTLGLSGGSAMIHNDEYRIHEGSVSYSEGVMSAGVNQLNRYNTASSTNSLAGGADITGGADSIQVSRAALWNVIRWTNLVINSVPELQWRCIGYERAANGDNDLNKPLYNIPNPNENLALISEEYIRSARISLEILHEEIFTKRRTTATSASPIHSYSDVSAAPSDPLGPAPDPSPFLANVPPQLLATSSTSSLVSSVGTSHGVDLLANTRSRPAVWSSSNHNHDSTSIPSIQPRIDIDPTPPLLGSDLVDNSLPIPRRVLSVGSDASFKPTLSRFSTIEFLDTIDASNFNENVLLDPNDVYYLLARPYISISGKQLGLAAFDINKSLLGFYSDESDTVDTAVSVRMCKLADCVDAKQEDVNILYRRIEEESLDDAENSFVMSLPAFYNLKEMVDAAFVRSWDVPTESFV